MGRGPDERGDREAHHEGDSEGQRGQHRIAAMVAAAGSGGRGGRIRTGDLLLPKQAISQTDLRPDQDGCYPTAGARGGAPQDARSRRSGGRRRRDSAPSGAPSRRRSPGAAPRGPCATVRPGRRRELDGARERGGIAAGHEAKGRIGEVVAEGGEVAGDGRHAHGGVLEQLRAERVLEVRLGQRRHESDVGAASRPAARPSPRAHGGSPGRRCRCARWRPRSASATARRRRRRAASRVRPQRREALDRDVEAVDALEVRVVDEPQRAVGHEGSPRMAVGIEEPPSALFITTLIRSGGDAAGDRELAQRLVDGDELVGDRRRGARHGGHDRHEGPQQRVGEPVAEELGHVLVEVEQERDAGESLGSAAKPRKSGTVATWTRS